MEDLFLTANIHQTVVICDTEEECMRKFVELNDNEHTVSFVRAEHFEDERPVHMHKLHEFERGSSRVLLMSYPSWYRLMDVLEEYAIDRHNLLVLHGLDAQEKHIVLLWLLDAKRRGFLRNSRHYHIIFEDGTRETFSVDQE